MDDSNKPLLQLIVRWLNKIILIVLDQGMILNYRIALSIKKKVMVRDEGAIEWIGVLMLEAK